MNSIIDPFDSWSWLALGLSLVLLTIGFILVIRIHRKIWPSNVNPEAEYTFILMRSLFGFTEPEEIQIVASDYIYSGIAIVCINTSIPVYIRYFFLPTFIFIM